MSVNAARRPRDASAGALLAFYKRVVSPALHAVAGAGGACRFQPTCSEYAAIAIAEHGAAAGHDDGFGQAAAVPSAAPRRF